MDRRYSSTKTDQEKNHDSMKLAVINEICLLC